MDTFAPCSIERQSYPGIVRNDTQPLHFVQNEVPRDREPIMCSTCLQEVGIMKEFQTDKVESVSNGNWCSAWFAELGRGSELLVM